MDREGARTCQVQGLPARVCWLGYGERAQFGGLINTMVRNGKLSGPIWIGRDHLDCGSVASPRRETEGMLDGSDAIADWPILNALLNTAGQHGSACIKEEESVWATASMQECAS